MDKSIEYILDKLPFDIYSYFGENAITEIHLRSGYNIQLTLPEGEIYIENTAMTQKDIEKVLLSFCQYTMSAYQEQISQGFITLEGGHRVGIGGEFYYSDNGPALKKVVSLNIRINNEKCITIDDNALEFSKGLLITGPPHSGKTTLLRNIPKKLSGNIIICDERKELYSQQLYCDYISGIKKEKAIEYATRSLNPDVIICDEIGNEQEAKRILSAVNTGVKFICTAHSDSVDSLMFKPNIKILLEAGIFDKIILLGCIKGEFIIKEIRNVKNNRTYSDCYINYSNF